MDTRYDEVPLKSDSDRGKKPAPARVFVDLESSSSSEPEVEEEEEEEENMDAILRQNALMLSDQEDDDEEDDDGDGVGNKKEDKWGKNKFTFYQEREEDSSSSDERLHEEEAQRIQSKRLAQMKDEDFLELPKAVEDGKTKKKKAVKEAAKMAAKKKKSEVDGVERIVAAVDGKTDKELASLLADLHVKAAELRETVAPLLQKAEAGEIETSSGLSFLELKNVLLLNYCLNLNFYLLLKAEGRPVKDHPVIDELVRLRLLLEKTKPIDEKLRPRVNRLLKTAALGLDSVMNDPSMLRANPGQMLQTVAEKSSGRKKVEEPVEDEDLVYRAPRATSMFFDQEESKLAKRERREQRIKERAAKSSIMKMVREEFADGPEEVSTNLHVMDVAEEEREAQREIQEYEEDNFIRLRPTKAQKKASKREFVDELKSLDDFGDVERAIKTARIRGAKDQTGSGDGVVSKMAQKLRETQDREFAVDPQQVQQHEDSRVVSKRDLVAESAYDAYLEENKKKRDQQRKQKYDSNPNARRRGVVQLEAADDGSGGKRSISHQMEQNRGLTQQRKKDISRVKNKKKFAKSEKKRAGMTRVIRKEDKKRYDGESSGINTNVVRSTKL